VAALWAALEESEERPSGRSEQSDVARAEG
jgi:hypothetical protein